MDDDERRRIEKAFDVARQAGRIRRAEQDRIADHMELLLYEAKETETCDMLVRLARHIFDPRKP